MSGTNIGGRGGGTFSALVVAASGSTIPGTGQVAAQAESTPSSASGGPLPQRNPPVREEQIEDALQALVAGLLRLPGTLVRPRWQATAPNQPTADTSWVALGITSRDTSGFPFVSHQKGGPSTLLRWPILVVLVTFYGPGATDNAEMLRDGFYIKQNLESLNLLGIRLVEVTDVVGVADLVNMQWIDRADLRIRLAMEQTRVYNILDIASSDGSITTDTGVAGSFLALDSGG